MPSIFTHAVVGVATGIATSERITQKRFWVLSILCPIIPDLDVLGLKIGIVYSSFLGHRGFSHSLLFALLLGILISSIFFRKEGKKKKKWLFYTVYFSIITSSHGILDALTNGGGGIAFLSPFDNERYSFGFRPIALSPLSIKAFLGERGVSVLKNEFIWVWLPSIILATVLRFTCSHKRLKEFKANKSINSD